MTTGIFVTNQFTQDLAMKSFASMITRLMPNGQAPLFGLTSMLGEETAVQIEHGFFTKTMLFPFFQLNGAVDAVQTNFVVDSTANLIPGMIMQMTNANRENVLIVSVDSSTGITVQRGFGSNPAAAAIDDIAAYQVGNAHEEASIRPVPLAINPVRVTNLTQIFRNSWALSESVRATMMIAGETNVVENRQDCAAFHAADIEKALFFGQKFQGTKNGQPIRTMDGLIALVGNIAYYPPSYSLPNVYTANATTNYTELENYLDPCFNQTTDPKVANERVLFVGGTARRVLNDIGRKNGTYYIMDGQTSYGLQFSSFKIARGTFRMIEHPLFNSNSVWSKMAVAVDLSTFKLAYLNGRKTSNKEFNMDMTPVDNGIDACGGTLTTELTCVVKNPPANAIIYNLTAGVADPA